MRMLFLLFKLWLLVASASGETTAAVELSGAKPGCEAKCDNIIVPYPFGIGIGCALSEKLYVTCNATYNPRRLFLRGGNVQIMGFSASEVRIKNTVAYKCYDKSGNITKDSDSWIDLKQSIYTFSDKNKFVSVGCNTIAFIQGRDSENYTSGCFSVCRNTDSVSNDSCSGVGCCQTSIPKELKYYEIYISRPYTKWIQESYIFSPCSYAFLADEKEFRFQALDISDPNFINKTERTVPVVLDWVIENITCEDAQRNLTSFVCQNNTDCVDSDNGPGYRCSCKNGYVGNPYMTPGCQDINECEGGSNQCLDAQNCINLQGSYNCTCPPGTNGDGRQNSTGCIPESKVFPVTQVTLGIGLGLLSLLIASCWLYFGLKKRSVNRIKEKFFKQNGGLLLQQHQMSLNESATVKLTRIYTAEELKVATNNYDESRILGQGGNGTVYKGVFGRGQSETAVAIKKSKIVDETQIEQFINEVVILTQTNHRHVVRLLGCCLESEVPLLVYEFISNGTLHEHIHNRPLGTVSSKFSWQNRLRIATETADALAYLHSAASIPIIHRDVKAANILLDDNYSTKVADFGASRLISLDQTQVSTLVQGTVGYLDPEYFQTSHLTGKSDVYSFGVILVELLTGERPLSLERTEDRRMLATHFILSMREDTLLLIIEERLVSEGNEEQLFAVADLALRCLNLKGEDRPTMREVLGELEGIRRLSGQHPWVEENTEEVEFLLKEPPDLHPFSLNASSSFSTEQYSINRKMSSLDLLR